ncbi:MAG: MFS transporter, partial [Gammaproteobacteria bacterium]
LMAVIGLCIFIEADNYAMAAAGRFAIGLGCAFAYIGTLKLASIWLPPNRFATAACLTTAIGMLSGALSQKYLTKVIEMIGYQSALRTALIAGVVLSIIVVMLVRNRPAHQSHTPERPMETPMNLKQLGSALRIIFTNPQMWIIGAIGCLLYLPSSVFLDLWGIPYLKTVYQLTPEQTVTISSCTFYGWIISGPLIGVLSDKIKRRRMPLIVTGLFAAASLSFVFYLPHMISSASQLNVIFFLVGVCCGAHSLCFALGKETNPIEISGTSVAVTNMLIMAGGAIFQPLVGKLLDMHTTSPIGANGLPVYTGADYTFALSVIPIGAAVAIFLSFFLKETYCESQAKEAHQRIFAAKKPMVLNAEMEVVK